MLSFTDVVVDKTRAAHTNNSTNTCFTSCLKDIQICIHAAADLERATQTKQSFQPHIIISVLQTFQLQKYWDKSL